MALEATKTDNTISNARKNASTSLQAADEET